jgi:DNA-binding NarL/FixJ family response regulator
VEPHRLGVGGVVLKKMAPRLLLQCLRKVYSGELWIERRAAAVAFDTLLQREAGAREIGSILTTREVEIARLVASGLRNRRVAQRLLVSEATVKTHLHNIYDKLNVESRGQLILYCTERGIARTAASYATHLRIVRSQTVRAVRVGRAPYCFPSSAANRRLIFHEG